jgi:hypothetical protein
MQSRTASRARAARAGRTAPPPRRRTPEIPSTMPLMSSMPSLSIRSAGIPNESAQSRIRGTPTRSRPRPWRGRGRSCIPPTPSTTLGLDEGNRDHADRAVEPQVLRRRVSRCFCTWPAAEVGAPVAGSIGRCPTRVCRDVRRSSGPSSRLRPSLDGSAPTPAAHGSCRLRSGYPGRRRRRGSRGTAAPRHP